MQYSTVLRIFLFVFTLRALCFLRLVRSFPTPQSLLYSAAIARHGCLWLWRPGRSAGGAWRVLHQARCCVEAEIQDPGKTIDGANARRCSCCLAKWDFLSEPCFARWRSSRSEDSFPARVCPLHGGNAPQSSGRQSTRGNAAVDNIQIFMNRTCVRKT